MPGLPNTRGSAKPPLIPSCPTRLQTRSLPVPNISPKRHRPKSGVDRERLTEINRHLNRRRLPDAERAALQGKKDRLSPSGGPGPASHIDDPVPLDVVRNSAEGSFQAATPQPIN